MNAQKAYFTDAPFHISIFVAVHIGHDNVGCGLRAESVRQ